MWLDEYKLNDTSYGFVYKIKYELNGKYYYYIGKKNIMSTRNKPAKLNGRKRGGHVKFYNKRLPMTKKDLKNRTIEQVRNNVKTKIVKYELFSSISKNWKSYVGSSKDIPKQAKILYKKILQPAIDKRELTYLETYYLFKYKVLERREFFNRNILGKFYKDKSLYVE